MVGRHIYYAAFAAKQISALAVDVERVRRINQTIKLVPPEARKASALKPVELLVIAIEPAGADVVVLLAVIAVSRP